MVALSTLSIDSAKREDYFFIHERSIFWGNINNNNFLYNLRISFLWSK